MALRNTELARTVGRLADQLVSVQFYLGGGASAYTPRATVPELYQAAREAAGESLSFLAAERLAATVGPGDTVVIATGFMVPPSMAPESDGPVGAASLARSLEEALGACVCIVVDEPIVPYMKALLPSAGIGLAHEINSWNLKRSALVGYPIDESRGDRAAEDILESYRPKAMIAIEKPGPNRAGYYHTGTGLDVSRCVARVDRLFALGQEQGILTIGVGDGGNEIGMGVIEDTVREILPPARDCGCACGQGVATSFGTDVCVVASVANWGAYAIAAVLAAGLGSEKILHSPDVEGRVIDQAARVGFIDPGTGWSLGEVDGLLPEMHQIIVKQLRTIVAVRLAAGGIDGAPRQPLSAEERALRQGRIDRWGEAFTDPVATVRALVSD